MFFYIPFCQEISNINLPFLFYKVLYSELSYKLALKRKNLTSYIQIWLPPSDNYKMNVLVQSDTAGHYRAIGDQVNMAPKDRSWEEQTRLFANAGIFRTFINSNRKKLFEI